MLSFTTPNVQSSLVVKSASTIRPGDRLVVGRAASQILPRLYLSNLFTARDEEQLLSLGITHVISVIETLPKLPESIKVLHIPIADSMDTNILQYLDQTTAFITAALAENEHNKVLVRVHIPRIWLACELWNVAGALSSGNVPVYHRRLCISHRYQIYGTVRSHRICGF